ncbi:MAG TPA: CDP-diacylglycerol--glycerol-3-phosphate 3-phosphatidyltransferase [Bacteroidota bacterium]|nr:CDP-diacylglycerol--glycerol-3-phosphate 3-phosphatidyltransferase [Bacteroidota bacterium]
MFSTLPNTLTFIRLVLSPVFFFMIIAESAVTRQLSLAVFFIAAITDWYDGEIARRSGTESNLGKFLDPLADKFLTSAAFLAFAVLGMVPWWMVIVIVLRDMLVTALRSLAENRGEHIVTSKTAQWKTFIQMIALYYLLLLVVLKDVGWIRAALGTLPETLLDPPLVYGLMLGVTVLTLFTGVQYIVDNRIFILRLCGAKRQVAG